MSDENNEPESPQPEAAAAEPVEAASPTSGGSGPDNQERQWAMFGHLSALAAFIFPFGNLIGPLIIWQVKKSESDFVADQAKEALNFQITVVIAFIVAFILSFILIGFLLMPVIGIGALVLTVIAALKANSGETYRYPLAIRLVT